MSPKKKQKPKAEFPGGYKQSAVAFDASNSSSSTAAFHKDEVVAASSFLVELLVFEFMWGFMTATMVQKICEAAVKDGLSHRDVKRLSTIGCTGVFAGNCWRDMKSQLAPVKIRGALGNFMIIMKTAFGRSKTQLNILWPHLLFSIMYHEYREEFVSRLCGGCVARIKTFWDSQANHPSYKSHPAHGKHRYDLKTQGIPLKLHGDGVTCVGLGKKASKHADCMSWSSLLARSSFTRALNFVMLFVFQLMQLKSCTANTMEMIWRNIVWSLYWLYQGVHPDRDADGRLYTPADGILWVRRLTPLADGFFGVLWVVAADLDWIKSKLEMLGLCFACDANRTNRGWTDCRDNATWIASIWTNETHAIKFPLRHILFRHLPGVGVAAIIPDVLHTKHLGTDAYYCGGVLKILVWYVMAGTPKENLDNLWIDIQAEYAVQRTQHRYTVLTLRMIQSSKSPLPQLSGRGSVIKDFVPVLAKIAEKHLNQRLPQHRYMLVGLHASRDLDKILDSHRRDFILPPLAAKEFQDGCHLFCQCTAALIRCYHPSTPAFHYTEKFHLLLHLAACSRYVNPDFGSCYQGEELMAIVRRILAASSRASQPHVACNTGMARYTDGLGMDLAKPFGFWRK